MSNKYFNPFQGMDIRVPNRFRDDFGRYCQTHSDDGGRSSVSHSPFPRMVDMWFLAFCLGAEEGTQGTYDAKDTYKIIDASILSSDPWRIDALVLAAVAHTGKADVIESPRDVLQLASAFAIAGLDRVIAMLRETPSEPIWNLSYELHKHLAATQPGR
jgi:hypothetical protein